MADKDKHDKAQIVHCTKCFALEMIWRIATSTTTEEEEKRKSLTSTKITCLLNFSGLAPIFFLLFLRKHILCASFMGAFYFLVNDCHDGWDGSQLTLREKERVQNEKRRATITIVNVTILTGIMRLCYVFFSSFILFFFSLELLMRYFISAEKQPIRSYQQQQQERIHFEQKECCVNSMTERTRERKKKHQQQHNGIVQAIKRASTRKSSARSECFEPLDILFVRQLSHIADNFTCHLVRMCCFSFSLEVVSGAIQRRGVKRCACVWVWYICTLFLWLNCAFIYSTIFLLLSFLSWRNWMRLFYFTKC